ncbi:MAG: PSP1 domain-containing protein [Bacteroidia bacterium]
MACGSCSSNKVGLPAGCNNNGSCSTGCGNMLDVYDWLSNVYYVDDVVRHPLVEVRFKGTRKGFYRNVNNLAIEMGQKLVVEAQMGGHDVGTVSLVGPLVKVQMKKYNVKEDAQDIKKVYRVATEKDIEKYREAKGREYVTMMKSREYARQLKLQMKISDVEFQGDNTKATFYYTADGRVDFRELIKVFAKNFKIKVEMRQIGLRQEAGRLGGIGSCGRELCCSTWLTDFNSVPTTAARYQNLFLNPLKLSGQCGRLKCCLNFELDTYLEALEDFPSDNVTFKTAKGIAKVVKTDILRKVMFFIVQDDPTSRFIPLDVEDVKDLIEQQKSGKLAVIEDIEEYSVEEEPVEKEVSISGDIIADDLDRFERKQKPLKKKKKRPNRPGGKPKRDNRPNQQNRKQSNAKGKAPESDETKENRQKQDKRPPNKRTGEQKPRSNNPQNKNKFRGNKNRNNRNRNSGAEGKGNDSKPNPSNN